MAGTLTKFVVEFEVEVYAATAGAAYERAIGHVGGVVATHQRGTDVGTPLRDVIDFAGQLPFGGLTGAPHETDSLEGWKLHWSVRVKED